MSGEFDIEDLFFGNLLAKAETLALLSVLERVCERAGIPDLGGRSLRDCFHEVRKAELEGLFRAVERYKPGLAARMHVKYESAKQALGDDGH